jgi:hypothetical protein
LGTGKEKRVAIKSQEKNKEENPVLTRRERWLSRGGKCKIDKEAVVDSRNYYSHFMPKDKQPKALDGYELYKLTIRLRILLVCCVLSLYGFDNSRINEIMKESHSKVLEL